MVSAVQSFFKVRAFVAVREARHELTKHGRLALLDFVPLEWKYEIVPKVTNKLVQNVEVACFLIVVFSQLDETLAVAGVPRGSGGSAARCAAGSTSS
jgi:hypothetical protein